MLDASAPHHDHARGAPTCVITRGKRRRLLSLGTYSVFLSVGQKMWTIFETRKSNAAAYIKVCGALLLCYCKMNALLTRRKICISSMFTIESQFAF
jgi:hypothetical protein